MRGLYWMYRELNPKSWNLRLWIGHLTPPKRKTFSPENTPLKFSNLPNYHIRPLLLFMFYFPEELPLRVSTYSILGSFRRISDYILLPRHFLGTPILL